MVSIFLLGSLTVTHSSALLDLCLSPDASICSTTAFPLLGNSDHVAILTSVEFPSNSEGDVPFHCMAYDLSRADWDGLRDHLRDKWLSFRLRTKWLWVRITLLSLKACVRYFL